MISRSLHPPPPWVRISNARHPDKDAGKMSFITPLITAFEAAPAPDFMRRAAINLLVDGARRSLSGPQAMDGARFAEEMDGRPIAEHADAANAQHYEVPAALFEKALGPNLKYSCCLFPTGRETLAEAEEAALIETAARAGLEDGHEILELGCGWGSLSLWMAATFPGSRITSVSNSASQRAFIEARARERDLSNLTVVTCDMNAFDTDKGRYDRVVSIEMFEHMANWRALLGRVRRWLKPDGRLFLHVFTHRAHPYRFNLDDPTDWIGKYFFSGGIMPSHDLAFQFPDLFTVEADWRWNGEHYARTARAWLERFDAAREALTPVLKATYGAEAGLWRTRWRLFFLATEGLFGHAGGEEWGVSHYLMRPSEGDAA
jgi:cyclopropane-fatty-acyl-phospholipid synthase